MAEQQGYELIGSVTFSGRYSANSTRYTIKASRANTKCGSGDSWALDNQFAISTVKKNMGR